MPCKHLTLRENVKEGLVAELTASIARDKETECSGLPTLLTSVREEHAKFKKERL